MIGIQLADVKARTTSRLDRAALPQWRLSDKGRRHTPALAKEIPHARDIIGFRNILAHGYSEFDHTRVYAIAVHSAPELLQSVQEALKQFPDPSERPG